MILYIDPIYVLDGLTTMNSTDFRVQNVKAMDGGPVNFGAKYCI